VLVLAFIASPPLLSLFRLAAAAEHLQSSR
jgi:hypothetical protein